MATGILLGTYRPFLTAPGIPGIDFAVGRTSTNPLSIGLVNTQTPLAGLSTTSVAIGTGSKTFTIAANQSNFTATDNLTICSAANNANAMIGTVTSYIGSSLVMNVASVTGSGTFTDWCLASHFPAQCSFTAPNTLRIGSTTADFSITDWDFRGLPCFFYLQNTHNISFSQCLFDLSGWTTAEDNNGFMGLRSGSPTYSVTNCTFDGGSSPRNVTHCLGDGLITCDHCDIINWPLDIFDLAAVSGQTTTVSNTRATCVSSTAASFGQHSDGSQMLNWIGGNGLILTHTTVSVIDGTPTGGSGATACINWGSNNGDWTAPVTIDNCIFSGGSYCIYHENKADVLATSPITYGANVYVGNSVNGNTYPASLVGCAFTNLHIPALKNISDGSAAIFNLNGLVSQTSVVIGNGTKTFTTTQNFPKLSGSIVIFNPPASGSIVNSMTGTVTSYDGTTLVCNITSHAGSGTFTEWGVNFVNITSYP